MSNPTSLQITQSSTLPPAQPSYILRGHTAQIHSVAFLRQNLRLLSGDAKGWVVLWNVPIKRPVAVWRAHEAAVLRVEGWGDGKVITHGRDNKLLVWQLRDEDERGFSTTLPIDDSTTKRHSPWLLHSLAVNALNFCAFGSCSIPSPTSKNPETHSDDGTANDTLIIAVPGLQDGQINLTLLPSEKRLTTIPAPQTIHSGLLMAVALHHPPGALGPTVVAGYESGHTCVWTPAISTSTAKIPLIRYESTSLNKPHNQPVLSLSLALRENAFYSSSADALVARHTLAPSANGSSCGLEILQTRHAGQQGLCVRGDGKIFATAGWDGRARVYATGKGAAMRELAVLKWHKEGCYALAFAEIYDGGSERNDSSEKKDASSEDGPANDDGDDGKAIIVVGKKRELSVAERRVDVTKKTHWLAAGSKDGKVSLWDIY